MGGRRRRRRSNDRRSRGSGSPVVGEVGDQPGGRPLRAGEHQTEQFVGERRVVAELLDGGSPRAARTGRVATYSAGRPLRGGAVQVARLVGGSR